MQYATSLIDKVTSLIDKTPINIFFYIKKPVWYSLLLYIHVIKLKDLLVNLNAPPPSRFQMRERDILQPLFNQSVDHTLSNKFLFTSLLDSTVFAPKE